MVWLLALLVKVAITLLLTVAVAGAQDRRQNEPGQFDFYVLALSWSPSFCEAAGERGTPPQQQCAARPYSFVVHGLWPQYEKGFPEFCQVPAPRLDRNIVSSMLDLMPAPRLIFHEWDKHGTCSGLNPRGYFETVRKARALVKIPGRLYRAQAVPHGDARRGRGGVREGQPGAAARCHRGDLRQPAAGRGAHLRRQGFPVSLLPGGRHPRRLPPRQGRDAAGARRRRRADALAHGNRSQLPA